MNNKDAAQAPLYAGPSKLMTVRELSTYLQVHSSTVYRLLKHHDIPGFRIGSDWRFNAEVIDRWCSDRSKLYS